MRGRLKSCANAVAPLKNGSQDGKKDLTAYQRAAIISLFEAEACPLLALWLTLLGSWHIIIRGEYLCSDR